MSRNSGGTYSLPAGNPVVPNTTVSSTWGNALFGDLATEITNSLDRSGRGPMLAPLVAVPGSAGSPGVSFTGETDTGLYIQSANTMGVSAGGTAVASFSSIGTTLLRTVTIVAGAANTQGADITGNGTAEGLVCTGGVSAAAGATFNGGAANSNAVAANGKGTGAGVEAVSESGPGLKATGNATAAPLRIDALASAPSAPINGDVYYDSGTDKLRVRAAGAWVDLH